MSKYFTQAECAELIGKRVRLQIKWAGVPAGTRGDVIGATTRRGGYVLSVRWDLPWGPPWPFEMTAVEEFALLARMRSRPLIDQFGRDEFRQYLEVDPGGE